MSENIRIGNWQTFTRNGVRKVGGFLVDNPEIFLWITSKISDGNIHPFYIRTDVLPDDAKSLTVDQSEKDLQTLGLHGFSLQWAVEYCNMLRTARDSHVDAVELNV